MKESNIFIKGFKLFLKTKNTLEDSLHYVFLFLRIYDRSILALWSF